MLYEELSGKIIGAAMEVHRVLGPGYLESVYEVSLALELTRRNIPFERQVAIAVTYKQTRVGEYKADMVVDGKIIVEIKAVSTFAGAHDAQTLHYLTATGFRVGLLLNFGALSLQFKRLIR